MAGEHRWEALLISPVSCCAVQPWPSSAWNLRLLGPNTSRRDSSPTKLMASSRFVDGMGDSGFRQPRKAEEMLNELATGWAGSPSI